MLSRSFYLQLVFAVIVYVLFFQQSFGARVRQLARVGLKFLFLCDSDSNYEDTTTSLTFSEIICGLVAWRGGNAFDSIDEVTLRRAVLILRWVTACGQVNRLGM